MTLVGNRGAVRNPSCSRLTPIGSTWEEILALTAVKNSSFLGP